MGIILAIFLFSAIIIIHELGHFLLAKANKIRVDEFSLGLGPTLFGKQIGETKFSIKLLPFGGACMMGEDDADDLSEGSFNSKSVWARMSVIVAGPLFNLILAWILCVIMTVWIGYVAPVITGVEEGYAAAEQGIQAGDLVTKIDGKRIHLLEKYYKYGWRSCGNYVFQRGKGKNCTSGTTTAERGCLSKAWNCRSVRVYQNGIFRFFKIWSIYSKILD